MDTPFFIRVPGKFVLAGEHSVLRGVTAVALPHPEVYLELKFTPGGQGLRIEPEESRSGVSDILRAVEDWVGARDEDVALDWPDGTLTVTSTIPRGAGLGSSAALCVAVTRWVQESLKIPEEGVFDFARALEDRFHGKSSGMDIAAILFNEPIAFSMEEGAEPLGVANVPKFTFHDTGLRARTVDCVVQVNQLHERHPFEAVKWDERMSQASRRIIEGLTRGDRREIAEGMNLAHQCYQSWQLVPAQAENLRWELLSKGALGVKLTGAGAGGFLVALES